MKKYLRLPRPFTPRTATFFIILSMLLAFSSGCSGEKMTGKPAPDFSLTTLKGTQVELTALKGRPVLVYFFASW